MRTMYSELPLIWTPEMQLLNVLPSVNLLCHLSSNQDTLTGPKGGRIRESTVAPRD